MDPYVHIGVINILILYQCCVKLDVILDFGYCNPVLLLFGMFPGPLSHYIHIIYPKSHYVNICDALMVNLTVSRYLVRLISPSRVRTHPHVEEVIRSTLAVFSSQMSASQL